MVCDKCGAAIDAFDGNEHMNACEIYIGDSDKPYYVAEDLCDGCVEAIRNTVDSVIAKKLTRKRPQQQKQKGDDDELEDSREQD